MKASNAMCRIAVLGLLAACVLFGEESQAVLKKLEVEHTERVDFPAGGTLRLDNSTGELSVEGWDRPDMEITTIKAAKNVYDAKGNAKAAEILDRVHITTERKDNEIDVKTEFPRRLITFPGMYRWHGVATSFALEYRIKVPRNARLIVANHNEGDIYVDNITGDVQVTSHQGLIAVHITGDAPGSIRANSKVGTVDSDFPGTERRHHLMSHSFLEDRSATGQKLNLQIGYGDIVILKLHNPQPPPAIAK